MSGHTGVLSRMHSKGKIPRHKRVNRDPLRKVVGYVGEREILECQHVIVPPQDFIGRTNAARRRCWRCGRNESQAEAERGRVRILKNASIGWLTNSLRHQRSEMEAHARRCRAAYSKEPLHTMAVMLAEAYEAAAAEFQKKLDEAEKARATP